MSDATGGSSVSRSFVPVSGMAFDLRQESDTLQLLQRIHQSILDTETKNELRDAIFAFRQTKADTPDEATIALFTEQGFTLGTHGAAGSSTAVETSIADTIPITSALPAGRLSQFGAARRTPSFAVVRSASVAKPSELKPVVPVVEPAAEPEIPVTPKLTSEPKPVAQEAVQLEPALIEPVLIKPEPVARVVASEPVVATAVTPTSTSTLTPTPVAAVGLDTASASAEINSIKHEINQLVGNPVHIIDMDDAIGREYMNALLSAMKKLNGATPQELQQSVSALEGAAAKVKTLIATHGSDVATVSAPMAESTTVPPVTTPPHSLGRSPVLESTSITASGSAPEEELPIVSEAAGPVIATMPAASVAPDPKVVAAAATLVTSVGELRSKPVSSVPPRTGNPVAIRSVADETAATAQMIAAKQAAAETEKQKQASAIAATDPLMQPDVNAGLEQLLSEWSLFKHSGLFGTGPHGSMHPLYKKLAKLTMAAVLAGRFEGASPQIKRSIMDTMNAWRYQNGIIHLPVETFEHYLRRVVRHILDTQKKA